MPVALALIGTLFGLSGAAVAQFAGHSPQVVILAWYASGWAAVLASLGVCVLRREGVTVPRIRR